MEIFERLRFFVENNFNSTRIFCELSGIDKSQICRYISGNMQPSASILQKLYLIGLNINWLLSGNGSIFADNPKGNELKAKHEDKYSDDTIKEVKERVKQWISDNFTSLESFIEKNKLSPENLLNELESTSLPTPGFMLCLSKAGCNIDWIMNGEGKVYSNNDEGFVLQTKKRISSENINEDKELQMEMFLMRVEERVKKVIRDEISNYESD